MPTTDADHLRLRATRLREMARALESSPVFLLDRYAGVDTWNGRRPDECRDELARRQAELYHAIEQLYAAAWLLDRRAEQAELLAALTW
jgi:hypothetical protein